MILIFDDFLDGIMEVFMDDFFVCGESFEGCLSNLEMVLKKICKCQSRTKLGKMPLHGPTRNCLRAHSIR